MTKSENDMEFSVLLWNIDDFPSEIVAVDTNVSFDSQIEIFRWEIRTQCIFQNTIDQRAEN